MDYRIKHIGFRPQIPYIRNFIDHLSIKVFSGILQNVTGQVSASLKWSNVKGGGVGGGDRGVLEAFSYLLRGFAMGASKDGGRRVSKKLVAEPHISEEDATVSPKLSKFTPCCSILFLFKPLEIFLLHLL